MSEREDKGVEGDSRRMSRWKGSQGCRQEHLRIGEEWGDRGIRGVVE